MREKYKKELGKFGTYYSGFRLPRVTYEHGYYFSRRPMLLISFFHLGSLYINMPWLAPKKQENEPENPSYGFYFYGCDNAWLPRWLPESFWIRTGKEFTCFTMPWSFTWFRTENFLTEPLSKYPSILREQRGVSSNFDVYWFLKENNKFYSEIHDITFLNHKKELETVKAKVTRNKRVWRRRALINFSNWGSRTSDRLVLEFDKVITTSNPNRGRADIRESSVERFPNESFLDTLTRVQKDPEFLIK
jgi:hypothetical protein